MSRETPFIYASLSEARNSTSSATSEGSPEFFLTVGGREKDDSKITEWPWRAIAHA